jgi:N-acetylglucosaminyltransferase
VAPDNETAVSALFLQSLAALTCFLHVAAQLSRGILQHYFASTFAKHAQPGFGTRPKGLGRPSVDVLVPCYNEDPDLLDACLTSLAEQDYQGRIRVFVVDDASRNRDALPPVDALRPILEHHGQRSGWQVILLDFNVGKRRAMDAALWLSDGEVVVVVDSDTMLRPDAISQIVTPFADSRVGAVSASNRALNAGKNLLTGLIDRSYWMLFEQERAAQSHFRAILCCHGAFAAFRRTALKEVWNRHLGKYRTGEDLHLTLRLLEAGYDTVLQPHAGGFTSVPETLNRYARQQRRWSRSFIREFGLAARVIASRSPRAYLLFDLVVQTVSPVLLAVGALLCLAQVVLFGLGWLPLGVGLIGGTMLITSIAAAIQAKSPSYLLYGLVYHAIVLPGHVLALVSPRRDSWKTRNLVPERVRLLARLVTPRQPAPRH